MITRKKAAAKPPLFSRPCGQLVGITPNLSHFWQLVCLCPTCLLYSLRHGRLRLIELFPHNGLPFYHQGQSLWSPGSFPLVTKVFLLVTKVFPLVTKVPLLHLHSFEVKCEERRTNEELTDQTESRTMAVISIDNMSLETDFPPTFFNFTVKNVLLCHMRFLKVDLM